jgi:hypothetical protein
MSSNVALQNGLCPHSSSRFLMKHEFNAQTSFLIGLGVGLNNNTTELLRSSFVCSLKLVQLVGMFTEVRLLIIPVPINLVMMYGGSLVMVQLEAVLRH